MNTEQKQRLLWIGGLTVVGIYFFAPSLLQVSTRRVAVVRPAAPPVQAKPLPAPATAQDADAPEVFDKLSGIWQGAALLPIGMCNMKLELRRKDGDAAHFAAFPVLACMPAATRLAPPASQAAQQEVWAALTPASAVLTGAPANGSLQFTVDKVVGKTLAGCEITGLTVTPFGRDMIAVQWQEGTCQGGQVLLRRMGR
jgi:hypothetical protein